MLPVDEIEQIVRALFSHQYGAVLAGIVGILVWLVRTYGGKLSPKVSAFLKSDPGGTILAFVTSFGVALGALGQVSLVGLGLAGKTAFLAIGGYSVLKKFVAPILSGLLSAFLPSSVEVIEKKAELQAKENAEPLSAKDSLDGIE